MNNTSEVRFHHYIKSVETEVSLETLPENNMSRSHAHDKYELYFLIKGSRHLLIKNDFYKIEEGDLLLFSPGVLHKTLNGSPAKYRRIVINFPKNLIKNILTESDTYENFVRKDAIIIRSKAASAYAADAICTLESLISDKKIYSGEFEFLMMSLLYRLMYYLVSEENILPSTKYYKKTNGIISDILNYINQNFTESITLAELSMRFYVSEFHLCRNFKKSTGRTITEYINYMRIEKAKQILTESKKPIKEIAGECGFKTTAHFNHIFKEYEKINPSQFVSFRK